MVRLQNRKSSIRRLRAGIVPSDHIEELSVGYEAVRDRMLAQLVVLEAGESVAPWLVQGEWGTGKSHFLSYMRANCLACGVASASVSVDARSQAVTKPQYYYPVLARSLRCDFGTGITAIVRAALEDSPPGQLERLGQFVRFIPTFSSSSLARAIRELLRSRQGGGSLALIDHPAWTRLTGEDLSFADYSYLREKALRRLQELARLSQVLGCGGLVVLFDEVETVDQLWNITSRMGAYRVLGTLCRMEYVWCIFAITDRFVRAIDADLDDGILNQPRLASEAKYFLQSWKRRNLCVIQPPTIGVRQADELGRRILSLYDKAHGPNAVEKNRFDGCIQAWCANPSANPRTLIRSVIHQLDVARSVSSS